MPPLRPKIHIHMTTEPENPYTAHMQAHLARLAREEAERASKEHARMLALETAGEEGQAIIQQIILPEMEALQAAVQASGKECQIKTSKTHLSGSEVQYEAEISISNNRSSLIYKAIPAEKLFQVTLRKNHSTPYYPESFPYSRIDRQKVSADAQKFITAAFPS